MTNLIIDAPMLMLCALCVIAIARYSARLTPKIMILRAAVFLAGIKLTVIWGIALLYRWNDVAGQLVAGFSVGFFLPEISLTDRFARIWGGPPPGPAFHSTQLSPLLSGLVLSAFALISSFVLSMLMVGGIFFVKRISLKKSLMPMLTLGLIGMFLAGGKAFAQTGPTIALPTKTVKILPTDDISVVGWIDGSAIPLPTDGVSTTLILTLAEPGLCDVLLNSWASNPGSPPTLIGSSSDLLYANRFLIKFSANNPPGATIDPATVATAGDYRLFNRLQGIYRAQSSKIVGTPKFPQTATIIGATPDPCRFSPISAAGQVHPISGSKGITASASGVFQVAEGRIGPLGQSVNATLNGHTTPWIWSVIKFDTTGNLIFPFSIGTFPNPQIMPTYSVYKNGQIIQTIPQGDLQTFINLTDASQISNTNQIP